MRVTSLAAMASIVSAGEIATVERPNVIIIYSDDHGYTDLALFGIDSNVDTPNMDSLATGGALMTGSYALSPQCRPSRVGLMIGRMRRGDDVS